MLLSFIAKQPINLGNAVTISTVTSGQIIPANPSGLTSASVIGISVDTVSSGALCRVVTDASASVYTNLISGTRYFLSPSGGYIVDYPSYVNEFNQLGLAQNYLTQLGVAINSTSLRVNPTEPKLVVSGYL